ncbi:MAG: alpha-amylase family glycosyl hydrolase [Minicystis sp.]
MGSAEQEIGTTTYNDLNLAAGTMILYEAQVRSANACDPTVGSTDQRNACAAKIAPTQVYRAEGMSCPILGDLQRIKLGTLDDMQETTADHRQGITLRYVAEKTGANTVWLMPLFPNNDTWNIPDACDNLGSPYAVRDYMHASGTLARRCIQAGADEYSATPCWGNAELDALIAQAHSRGLKVMLDVALNHFGHNYLMYDYVSSRSVRDRVAAGENLDNLWDFAGTYDAALVNPALLDTPAGLTALAAQSPADAAQLAVLQQQCPGLSGDALVRAFHMWRNAFDWERAQFSCSPYLEFGAPGFYLGANRYDPSTHLGDNFTNDWHDVKFLYHHEENTGHTWEFVRNREYLFHVMNYWASRGVDGFRLDHTTDGDSGMGPNEWKYLTSKVDYYAYLRGQARPVFLAEEFADQMGMNHVVDVMTEGYVGDMCGRNGATKNTSFVEGVLNNMDRFGGHAFVMTALETHDEHRLLDGTGFSYWTGAGFWGIGATTRSTPMMLMGQEFGEWRGLGFRRADYLHARFVGSDSYTSSGDALAGYYQRMASQRLAYENRALVSANHAYLRSRWTGQPDQRIFAQVKWSNDLDVVFVFHNLWEQWVSQSYYIDSTLAATLGIQDGTQYKLIDAISGNQMGGCRWGSDLKWDFYVEMDAGTRAQWLRLERCN